MVEDGGTHRILLVKYIMRRINTNDIKFRRFFGIFPLVAIIYYIVPAKIKYIWLLAASYYFYISCDIRFLMYLLPLTLLTYSVGMGVELQWGDKNKILKYCRLPINSNSGIFNISSAGYPKICRLFCY